MSWSLTTLLIAVLPVAGTLIVMNWALRDGKRQSGLIASLTQDEADEAAPQRRDTGTAGRPPATNSQRHGNELRLHTGDSRVERKNVARLALALTGILIGYLATSGQAASHESPWRAGEARQVGFGSCSKGACTKRTCWSSTKPHKHVRGKVVMEVRGTSRCWTNGSNR